MRNLVYEIREDEVLLDNYYSMGVVEEVIIFREWLDDDGIIGVWARQQMGDTRWKKSAEMNIAKRWVRLSKDDE